MTGNPGSEAALAWCTFPDAASARNAAAALLGEGLIACANIVPGIESLFVWDGAAQSAQETGVLFKTTAAALDRVIACLGSLHPYDTPAIIGWRCDAAHPATARWLDAAIAPA
jgi:periplasmic divalent cation tolerance protein